MYRQFTTLLFLFAFFVQTFSKVVIVCSFYANQPYIAKNLCENRDKPKSCCEGKCQLRKKLNRDANDEKQGSARKASKETEVLAKMSFLSYYLNATFKEIASTYTTILEDKVIDKSYPVFHPPCV